MKKTMREFAKDAYTIKELTSLLLCDIVKIVRYCHVLPVLLLYL